MTIEIDGRRGIVDGDAVLVVGRLALGAAAVGVGGVLHLAGVDVVLVDDVGRAAGDRLARIEAAVEGGAADRDERIGHDDAGEGHVAGVGDEEGVADRVTRVGDVVGAVVEDARLDDRDRHHLGHVDGLVVGVADGLALRRGRADRGRVEDLAGVDVGLGDGIAGGAGGGLTGAERAGRRRAADGHRRVGHDDAGEGHVAGVLEIEGVADDVTRAGDAIEAQVERAFLVEIDRPDLGHGDVLGVAVGRRLALRPAGVDIGGVDDLAGIDVVLVDGIAGGAGDGLTGAERVDRRRAADADRRVGHDGAGQGHVAGVGDIEGVADEVARAGDAVEAQIEAAFLVEAMVTTWGMSTVTLSSSLAGWPWGPLPSASRCCRPRRRRCRPGR